MRPNTGICISKFESIIGKKLNKSLQKGSILCLTDLY